MAVLERDGWSVLESRFSRGATLERLAGSDLGYLERRGSGDVFFARAEALLLMDDGPSDALDKRLHIVLSNSTTPGAREYAEHLERWVRAQVAKA